MVFKFLSKNGLLYYHNKVKALLDTKAPLAHTHDIATHDKSGFMSPADKILLDNLPSGEYFSKDFISQESNITKEKTYALDAIQHNPNIKGTMAYDINLLKENTASTLVNRIDYLKEHKTDIVTSFFSSALYKFGRIAIFCADITFDIETEEYSVNLSYMPEDMCPIGNLSVNILSNQGNPIYFYVDSSDNGGRIGIRALGKTVVKLNTGSDGVRCNLIYITKE